MQSRNRDTDTENRCTDTEGRGRGGGMNWETGLTSMHYVLRLSLSRVRVFVTPWTVPARLLCPREFSRREDWSGLPCPPQGDVLTPGSEPRLLHSGWIPLPSEPPVKHQVLLKADKRSRQLKDGTCQYLLWPTWARPSCPEAEFKANGRYSHCWKRVVLFLFFFSC